jgi:hypothetical protein
MIRGRPPETPKRGEMGDNRAFDSLSQLMLKLVLSKALVVSQLMVGLLSFLIN